MRGIVRSGSPSRTREVLSCSIKYFISSPRSVILSAFLALPSSDELICSIYIVYMKDPVVQVGDPVLRQRAKPIGKKDLDSKPLKALIKRMRDVLAQEEFGVAIAAPQVGESLRVF